MKTREIIWKEYPLDFEFEGNFRIEVSNYGDIKTYNKLHPTGKVINGSTQGGFPIVRIKLFKKRSPKDAEKLEEMQNRVDFINAELRTLGQSKEAVEKKALLRAERDEIMKKRKKLVYTVDKKRCINFMLLKHKAVAQLFLPPAKNPDEKFVIHKDFDKTNNFVNNLAWASQETINSRFHQHPKMVLYKFKKQFIEQKPHVKTSKLSENQVLTIKKRLKKGYTLSRLAKQFGVSDMQIHRIKTGENWSHVQLIEDLIGKK